MRCATTWMDELWNRSARSTAREPRRPFRDGAAGLLRNKESVMRPLSLPCRRRTARAARHSRECDMCGRPLRSKRNLQERCGPWSGADMCAASAAAHTPQARMGVRGSGQNQSHAFEALVAKLVFLIRSLDRAPSLSFAPPTPRQPRGRDGAYTAATGARYTPPLASSAQTIRAIVLASATRTSRGGLRASMRPSHEPAGTPLRAAQRATALAPMISKRRSERSPVLYHAPVTRTHCRWTQRPLV